MKQRFTREDDRLDPGSIIVRGGRLHPGRLRASATRNHHVYGAYGISVLAARGTTVAELAQRPPLVRFPVLTLMTARDLLQAGLHLEPTGRNPQHFDIGFDDLDAGIEALLSCDHEVWANPYHER